MKEFEPFHVCLSFDGPPEAAFNRKGAVRRLSQYFLYRLHVAGPHKELGIVYVWADILIVNDEHDEVDQGNDPEDTAEGQDITYPSKGCSTQVQAMDTQTAQEKVQQDGCYEGLIAAPELGPMSCHAAGGVYHRLIRKGSEAGVYAVGEQLFYLLVIDYVLAASGCKSTNRAEGDKSEQKDLLHNILGFNTE